MFQLFRRDVECRAVHPNQVSAFQRRYREIRQVVPAKFLHEQVVRFQVCRERIQPILSFVVGSYRGFDAEGVDIAHFVDVNRLVDFPAHAFARRNDVGYL